MGENKKELTILPKFFFFFFASSALYFAQLSLVKPEGTYSNTTTEDSLVVRRELD